MPNHIKNVIVSNPGGIAAIRDRMKGETEFDFGRLIPMPEELKGTRSPAKIVADEEIAQREYEEDRERWGDSASRPITRDQHTSYMERFGANNWYDWALKHWGTKWGAYAHGESTVGGEHSISFETAWACPKPIVHALAEALPGVPWIWIYADEDWGSNLGSWFHSPNCAPRSGEHSIPTLFAALLHGAVHYLVEDWPCE